MVMSSGAVEKVQSSTLDGDLVLFAGEDSLQLWASNTYRRAQRVSSPWSSDPREGGSVMALWFVHRMNFFRLTWCITGSQSLLRKQFLNYRITPSLA